MLHKHKDCKEQPWPQGEELTSAEILSVAQELVMRNQQELRVGKNQTPGSTANDEDLYNQLYKSLHGKDPEGLKASKYN